MTDIPELIERLRSIEHADVPQKYLMLEAAEALSRLTASPVGEEQMARENAHNEKVIAGLNKQLNDELDVARMLGAEMEKQGKRIRELEAERGEWKEAAEHATSLHARSVAAAQDAIRAKTVEECAIHVAMFLQSRIGEQAAAAIRALCPSKDADLPAVNTATHHSG